ncbi:hypothetical protein K2173_001697 [Erythroxylum novogranatense]|uniref:Protein kinase domain-containing protein n=1 Tax=Erythroxylum novogranatense TaxID=1862640 RepID=A0AAV8S4Z7_9ROSI|nr:hypothetical protein K2173_001697 [Erythroxylum novogranatense]
MEKILSALWILIISPVLSSCYITAIRHCGNCGHTTVPYPLSTGIDCGDQLYKIRYTAGNLRFDALNGASYSVTSINPLTQRIIIEPASLISDSCMSIDFHSQGLQLNHSLPFNITSVNTILFLNCKKAALHLKPPMECRESSICHNYIKEKAVACMKEPFCCTFKTGGLQNGYESFVNLDVKKVAAKQWPVLGIEIQLALPQEPICKTQQDCKDILYSKCLADRMKLGQNRCFCDAGLKWEPFNGLCQNVNIVKCHHGKACKRKKKKTALFAGAAFAGGTVLIMILSGIVLYKQYHNSRIAQKNLNRERKEMLNAKHSGKSARIFTGKKIVFKGVFDDGTITAIKQAKLGSIKGTDQVLNEVRIRCQINHRSLVRLLGCCVELKQPIMIYEYISNGTLFEHLLRHHSGKWTPLTWHRRHRIVHQTAEAFFRQFLHHLQHFRLHKTIQFNNPPIYHRDIKSSNILLNKKMNAKVSDFGLSRLVEATEKNDTHIFTSAQGTLGHLDPEYYWNFQLTDKSDVYSFGVVFTSKKAIDFNREGEDVNLVVYIKKAVEEDRFVETIDPLLKESAGKLELETMKALGSLASACLDKKRQNRPSTKEVADDIECTISIASEKASKS